MFQCFQWSHTKKYGASNKIDSICSLNIAIIMKLRPDKPNSSSKNTSDKDIPKEMKKAHLNDIVSVRRGEIIAALLAGFISGFGVGLIIAIRISSAGR